MLSGSLSKTFAGGYTLISRWTATQDEVNNRSTVTIKTYIEFAGNSYDLHVGTRTLKVKIEYDTMTHSVNPSRSVGQSLSKLLATDVKTYSHDDNGNKTITLNTTLDINATISGSWVGTISTDKNFPLDKIERAMMTIRTSPGGAFHRVPARIKAESGLVKPKRIWIGTDSGVKKAR